MCRLFAAGAFLSNGSGFLQNNAGAFHMLWKALMSKGPLSKQNAMRNKFFRRLNVNKNGQTQREPTETG